MSEVTKCHPVAFHSSYGPLQADYRNHRGLSTLRWSTAMFNLYPIPPTVLLAPGWKNSREGACWGISFYFTSCSSLTPLEKRRVMWVNTVFPLQPQGGCLCQHQQKIVDWKWLAVAPELDQHSSWNHTRLCVPMWKPENNVFIRVLLKWEWFFKNPRSVPWRHQGNRGRFS